MTSFVYFILRPEAQMVRIGYTTRADGRFIEHWKKYGAGLRLLGVIPGGRAEESSVHSRFAELRIGQSEWFNVSPVLLQYIESQAEWTQPFCDIAQKALDGLYQKRTPAAAIDNRLGVIMADRGLSVYDLAELAGLPPATVKSVAQSARIDLAGLAAICLALDTTPGDLLALREIND